MHFGFALELSNVDLLNIGLLGTHLDLLETDIPSKYFACLHNVFKTKKCLLGGFRFKGWLGKGSEKKIQVSQINCRTLI